MATYSTGVSATWAGTPFTEVVDISYTYGSGLPKGRDSVWTDDLGTVSVTSLGTANFSIGQYGQRGSLSLSGGGMSLSQTCVCESLTATPELNGVTRFTMTFRILDG